MSQAQAIEEIRTLEAVAETIRALAALQARAVGVRLSDDRAGRAVASLNG